MDLSEAPAVLIRRHPWEVARLGFFRRLLASRRFDRAPLRILDVGSGDAWLAKSLLPSLHPGARITCWDAAYEASDIAKLAAGSDPRIEFVAQQPAARFDCALLLDVLEHIAD